MKENITLQDNTNDIDINNSSSNYSLWNHTLAVWCSDNDGPVDDSANNYLLRGSKDTLWEGGLPVGFI